MILNEDSLLNIVQNSPNGSEMKIFLYIAIQQPKNEVAGFKTTKEQLAIDLNLQIRTIFRSLRWLNENLLVQEVKSVDHSDFMVNPYFVMNNFDREARIAEWNRRSILDSQRKIRLRKEKRRREQKKASQQ